jgi:hypothetical protein
VFVLGAPRSGTTLLRVMLAGHPRLWSPPEMVLAPFATMAERRKKLDERFWEKGGLRRALIDLTGCGVDEAKTLENSLEGMTVPEVYSWLQDRLGDRILVDKCPHLGADPPALQRLVRWFPDAKFIWIVRHPGSVTRSIENMPMAEVMLQGFAPDARDIWVAANRNIRSFLAQIPADRQVLIKYEDLVKDARPAMTAVCAMLGLEFSEKMLDPYEGDRMRDGPSGARAVGDPNLAGRGKIQPELADSWLAGFDPASVSPDTHGLARELGYDLGALPPPPIHRVTAGMTALFDAARELEPLFTTSSDVDAVEGRRFLLRMVSASLDLFVEGGDADLPELHHAEGPHRKSFADNPDADYWRANLKTSDSRAYTLWGRVPKGTTYVGILLYRRGGQIGNRLPDSAFVQDDGTFQVHAGTQAPVDPSTTWLKADGDETALIVRQYFEDRATQAPIELHIRYEGAPTSPVLTADAMAKSLDRAKRNLETVVKRTIETRKMAQGMALNKFVAIGGEALFPTPDNTYAVCWYRFGADQTMLVRGKIPKGRWFSVTLYNAWMESLDYTRAVVHRNHRALNADSDGNFEVQLSHRDLGHPCRLDVMGHLAGYLLIRALLPEEPLVMPTIQVMYEREYTPSR